MDLNNDEQLVNDQDQDSNEVYMALKSMIEMHTDKTGQLLLLESMSSIEPFSQHPEVVEQIKQEVESR